MENTPETKTEESTEKKEKKVKAESSSPKEVKTKLLLTTSPDHPLSVFQSEIKKRNIKETNLNDLLLEALDQVSENWWEEKIEQLTPLEFKVKEALSNPQMREKLATLLTDKEKEQNQTSNP